MDTQQNPDAQPTTPPSETTEPSNVPTSPIVNTTPPTPQKRRWLTPSKIVIIVLVVFILMLLGSLSSYQKKNSSSTTDKPQTTVPQASINGVGSIPATSKATPNEKSYFNTVWTHLDSIGKLSQKMNQSCSVSFPAPEPCTSDIKVYQQELYATKTEMDQVAAPASFSKADATLRSALETDIDATNDALSALQTKNWGSWFSALSKHAQAGQKLNQAGSEALAVLQ